MVFTILFANFLGTPVGSDYPYSYPAPSLGGAGVCLIYACDHPGEVSGVVNWNGITNVDLFTDEEKEAMRTTGRGYVRNARTGQEMPLDRELLDDLEANRERFNILKGVPETKVPVLLV